MGKSLVLASFEPMSLKVSTPSTRESLWISALLMSFTGIRGFACMIQTRTQVI